jgi:hypothetical protein
VPEAGIADERHVMSRTGAIARGTNAPDPWRRAGFRISIVYSPSEGRMRSYLSNRHCAAGVFLVLSLFCGGALGPSQSMAAGALAVGLPPDVAKGGFTYGYSNNNDDANHAEYKALNACRTTKDAAKDVNLRSLCRVIKDYSDQCIAVAMDPAAGTPGVGWAVANDLMTAERQALGKCEDTAGPDRRASCVVDHSSCDGSAK